MASGGTRCVPTMESVPWSLASTRHPPGLPGGIVTGKGGSQAGPDDVLWSTLSPGSYFYSYFSYF